MRIANYLRPECVALHQRADSLEGAVQQLVALLDGTEDLTDTAAFAADVRARLALGGVCVGNGLAIPHAKSASVKRLQLAALTLDPPLACDTPDGKPLQMLVMIAAPAEANDLHVQVLAELATLFLDTDFCTHLRESTTPEAFCRAVAEREAQDDPAAPPPQTTDEPGYRLLGVTACPTGIAHTYMAAESLENMAKKLGVSIKVETDGSGGAQNVLTKAEIDSAEAIIVAADKNVGMARFNGKPVIQVPVADGIHKAEELINRAVSGSVPVYHHQEDGSESSASDEGKDSIGRTIYKHLMNGVSHMLPFVIGGGILIALAFLLDDYSIDPSNFGKNTPLAAYLKTIGEQAFGMMLPILAGFIAMSIADRPGLAVGLVAGLIAKMGCTFANPAGGDVNAGFLGALFAGFAGGYLVLGLRKLFSKLPKSLEGIKPVLLYPVIGIFLAAVVTTFINPYMGMINDALTAFLNGMGGTSRIVLGMLLGGMMSIDMGGPFNKAAYVFGTAQLAEGNFEVMASVMAGGMVPPIAIALCTTFFKKKFTEKERQSGLVNYIMGLSFITEGAIPFAAQDPLRVIPSCAIGAAVAGGLSMAFGCTLRAPHGGMFVLPTIGNPLMYLAAVAAGSVVGCLILGFLKKDAES